MSSAPTPNEIAQDARAQEQPHRGERDDREPERALRVATDPEGSARFPLAQPVEQKQERRGREGGLLGRQRQQHHAERAEPGAPVPPARGPDQVAVPLAGRGVPVAGIELSRPMIDQ